MGMSVNKLRHNTFYLQIDLPVVCPTAVVHRLC